jgi:SAM-dependent methyltransferase
VSAFAGVAEDYQRCRPPYPDEVFAWIAREYGLDGRGRLLDVGCGTGYVALPLSVWFDDVVATDPEPDMLDVAAREAQRCGVRNIRFLRLSAEEVPPALAPLRLATFGNSFHWTDRVKVAHALFPLIVPGGGLIVLASSRVWGGAEPWKTTVLDTMNAWLGPGPGRRVVGGRQPGAPRHEEILRATPFGEPRMVNVVRRHVWTSETLLGLLYSSSLQIRQALGSRTPEFERDIRARLLRLAPDDRFIEDIEFTIVSARKS